MEKKIKIIDILCYISIGDYDKLPKRIEYQGTEYIFDEDDYKTYKGANLLDDACLTRYITSSMLNDIVEILDEEEKEIEIPQEFLKDVTMDSEIVLIKDDIGHDYGYKNSIGFITSKKSLDDYYIFAFDKRVNRWWECRFEKDEYIRTGLFISDLFKPFAILTPSEEDEFEDIREITQECFDNWTCAKHINQLIKNQKKIISRLKDE